MKPFPILLLVICITIISCSYECNNATANIGFLSFPVNETDTIIVRKFTKSSNFKSLIDTFSLNQNNSSYQSSNDTLEIYNTFGTDDGLLGKYDYEIYLPEINRLYQISEITEEFRSINTGLSCNKVGCINYFRSYKVNGQLINGNSYHPFYLVK